MINYTEIKDGDAWEMFCRDYLIALGLVVEIPPSRGPDGGLDLLLKEQLKGSLASQPFSWLVSCKHYAKSGKSVGTQDETNITDRLAHHQADGFMGFYSTTASSGLTTRLKELRGKQTISAFEIFDGARIESSFHDVGLSGVLLMHLPTSHTLLRPIHPLLGSYAPLECEACGKDLLKLSVTGERQGVVIFGVKDQQMESVHFTCKRECDREISARVRSAGLLDRWDDIEDYFNPLIFLSKITGYINQMRNEPKSYSDSAHKKMIDLYMKVSQRTLRQTNTEDRSDFFRTHEVEKLRV